MKIVVTADHVRAGEIRSCVCCPIALAILEAVRATIPTAQVLVHTQSLYYRPRPFRDWFTVPLPDAVRTFIRDFDAGRIPGPFEFELPIGPEHDPAPTNSPAAVAA